ncbi:MAG: hypothetical protein K2N13_03900 [Paraprevotella sp.]|nr:hypothetical protein [Paraprevotella sp.]
MKKPLSSPQAPEAASLNHYPLKHNVFHTLVAGATKRASPYTQMLAENGFNGSDSLGINE